MATPALFDLASAQRIAAAVRKVEIGDRSEAALRFRSIPPPSGGSKVKFAIYTAAEVWSVASYTAVTNDSNTKTIQFAFPTATQSVGTAVITVSDGATAKCVNHMAIIAPFSTSVTAEQRILVMKEGGMWRLIGAQM